MRRQDYGIPARGQISSVRVACSRHSGTHVRPWPVAGSWPGHPARQRKRSTQGLPRFSIGPRRAYSALRLDAARYLVTVVAALAAAPILTECASLVLLPSGMSTTTRTPALRSAARAGLS